MLSILPVLQFLVGGAPVAQRRSPSGQVEGKPSIMGVSVALLHVLLSLFCVYKSATEVEEQPEKFKEQNNVMRGIIDLGHCVAIVQQPLMAVGTWLQGQHTVRFFNSLEELDLFLCVGVRVRPLAKRMRLLDRMVSVAVLLVVVLNVVVTHYVFLGLYQEGASPHDMYANMFPLSSYLVNVLTTCTWLYGLLLRMHCFNRMAQDLCRQRETQCSSAALVSTDKCKGH